MSTQFRYSSRGPLLSKWLLRQRSVHNLPSQNRGRNQYPLCKCMLTPTWRGRTNTRTTYWRLRINGSVGSARESNYFTLNEEKLNTQPHDESGSNIHVNTCIDSNSLKVCKLHRGAHFFFLLNLLPSTGPHLCHYSCQYTNLLCQRRRLQLRHNVPFPTTAARSRSNEMMLLQCNGVLPSPPSLSSPFFSCQTITSPDIITHNVQCNQMIERLGAQNVGIKRTATGRTQKSIDWGTDVNVYITNMRSDFTKVHAPHGHLFLFCWACQWRIKFAFRCLCVLLLAGHNAHQIISDVALQK